MITYVKKEEIYPSFGLCYKDGTIKIREDLPQIVKDFLLVHETYHSTDKATNWIWREIKANGAGLWKHPIGFTATLLMSLSPYRLKYYFQRFRDKQ